MMKNPVKIAEIRTVLAERNYAALRALYELAKVEGIHGCDEYKASTICLSMLEVSMFHDTSPGHVRLLEASLDAIERGNHPYDDVEALATIATEAIIAEAQLKAMIN